VPAGRLAARLSGALLSFSFLVAGPPSNGASGLTPHDARALLERLLGGDEAARSTARLGILRSADRSLIPALVDALFFASSAARPDVVACLEALSGEKLGESYRYWVEYVGGREGIRPMEGYRAWKAALFSRIDPAFARFLDPAQPTRIRPEEIVWGGVKKDGIPALKTPPSVPAGEAAFLTEDEMVFGVSFGGASRAYPQRIMDWHEMVNDTVGGQSFAISYCTLCGSAIAFATQLSDGRRLLFGSSGLLYRSNKLMYDEETLSLWSNMTGEPVAGALAGRGVVLPVLPMTITRWADWKRVHPETTVASLRTGFDRDYSPGAAYGRYFESPETMFPVWIRDGALEPKKWIYGIRHGSFARAFPLDVLFAERVVNDAVGPLPVVLVSDPAGGAVRAFARGERILAEGPGRDELIEPATGHVFRIEENALRPRLGGVEPLRRVPGHRAYWFGWYAFHPETSLYEGCIPPPAGGR
jgi:hypothetical protein